MRISIHSCLTDLQRRVHEQRNFFQLAHTCPAENCLGPDLVVDLVYDFLRSLGAAEK